MLQVSVYGMAEMSDEEVESALRDAARVLKPGKVHLLLKVHVTFTLECIINNMSSSALGNQLKQGLSEIR